MNITLLKARRRQTMSTTLTARQAVVEDDSVLRRLIAGWLLSSDSVNTRAAYRRDRARWLDWRTTGQLEPLRVGRTWMPTPAGARPTSGS